MNSRRIKLVFLAGVLLSLVLLNVFKNRALFSDPDHPYDARNVYLAGRLWSHGQNPYNDSLLKAEWAITALQNNIASGKPPGFPDCGMIYPFWSIPMLFPYFMVPWSPFYRILIFAIGLICVVLLARILKAAFWEYNVSASMLLIILLCYKSTVTAILLGQPMLPALLAIAGSWLFYRKGKPVASGLLLGIAMLKITLCIPLIIFYMIRSKYKTLFVSAIVPICSGILFFLIAGDIYIGEMLRNMQTQMELNYPGHRVNAVNTSLTEAGILFNYMIGLSHGLISNIQNGLLLVFVAGVWLVDRKNKVDDHWLISFLVIAALLLNYHLIYDGLLIILIAPVVIHSRVKWLWGIGLLPLFLPVNGLFRQTEWVQFHLPVTLIFLFLLNLYEYRNNQSTPVASTGR